MRFLRPLCAALLVLCAQTSPLVPAPHAQEPSGKVVISQIYGAGGNNASSTYNSDYIELYNAGTVPVPLNGWSVQYASASGTGNLGATNQITRLPDITLLPGRYFLVGERSGGPNGASLPDPFFRTLTGLIDLSGVSGKVALVRSSTSLGCNGSPNACSDAQLALIADLVGYGAASFFEGAPAPGLNSNSALALLRKEGGAVDTDNNRNDFVTGPPSPRNSGNIISLAIADVSVTEGDAADSVARFTIRLGTPAIVPVTFTIEARDGSAQAGLDFVAHATSLTIPINEQVATFDVTILADTRVEPDETFEVVLSNVSGTTLSDDRAVGTILNDDFAEYPIHELQGPGGVSPLANQMVKTSGIVTGLKSGGFFLQTPDDEIDADPATSQGVFVFTGSAPTVAIGDAVRVTGRLIEFRRTNDARPGTLTEIGSPVGVTPLSSGNPLPAPVPLERVGVHAPTREAQLERYEGMLVQASSLAVVGPTNGFGEFYGVLPGTARPFREPGIDVDDTLPADAPGGVARFDGNLERVMVDSDEGLTAARTRRAALPLATGATVGPIYGPLDYAFDEYRVSLDGTRDVVTTPGVSPRPLAPSAARELSVVSLNVLNFFPTGTSAAAAAAFARRVESTAGAIVNDLRTPDILGLIEIGDINGLRLLRDRVNGLAGTSYEAYLVESDDDAENDQDVGYLVNLARVQVDREPYPIGRGETFTLCGITDALLDRPPFVLEARFEGTPVTVIVNHLRSLIDVNSTAPFGPESCTETLGSRVREKRRLGAEFLADAIQARADQNLVVMGDMNAFEVNDGYGDIIGTLEGTPAAADTVVEASVDRWSYTMTSLARLVPPAERYSYVHEGNAQVLDHILVDGSMRNRLTTFGFARINADFPERERLSDHDAVFARFAPVARLTTATDLPAALVSGSAFSLDVTVSNAGPDRADDVAVVTTLPAGVSFDSATAPEGWSCAAASNAVTCTAAAALEPGASVRLVLHATAACELAQGTTLSATTTASSPDDADSSDNGSGDAVTVSNPAPVISGASPGTPVLEAPNHKMRDVRVAYTVTDNCGTPAVALSVTSNEPINGTGDGDAAPDWEVVDGNLVRLRAERAGNGTGRLYTITITATDSAGHVSTQAVTVAVPRDR